MTNDMDKKENQKTNIVPMDASWNKDRMYMGMNGVDPNDIRPPQIILIQKSSDLENLKDMNGNIPKVGQFFHTGQGKIMDSFECFFLSATKGIYVDRNKDGHPVRDQYTAIGLLSDDMSIFGYNFRSSALYALSKLFTAVVGLKRPMFSIRCTIGVKELNGDKGKWWIPVIENWKPEDNGDTLIELEGIAKKFNTQVKKVEEVTDEVVDSPKGDEDVAPSDIPF